jgi:hypothetical protein
MKKWIFMIFILIFMLVLSTYYIYRVNPYAERVEAEKNILSEKMYLAFEKRNHKYAKTILFFASDPRYGKLDTLTIKDLPRLIIGEILSPVREDTHYIDYILIIDNETGQSVRRNLLMKISSRNPDLGNFSSALWSPDEEYLILPKNDNDSYGFVFYNAKTVIEDMKQEEYSDALSIQGKGSGAYFLQVLKWEGPSSFSLSATLSYTSDAYQYDIKTKRLSCFGTGCSKDGYGSNNEAENSTGLIKIEELPQRRPLPQPPLSAR